MLFVVFARIFSAGIALSERILKLCFADGFEAVDL